MTTSHIQDTDVFADTHSAITFDLADETWIVTAGVLVAAASDDAVFGELDFQSLVNSGSILSAAEFRRRGGNSRRPQLHL